MRRPMPKNKPEFQARSGNVTFLNQKIVAQLIFTCRKMKRTTEKSYYKAKKQKVTPKQREDAQVARIKRLIGVESKYYDMQVGFAVPTNATWASTMCLTIDEPRIVAGDDSYQRNGKKVLLKKIAFRGAITTNLSAVTGTSVRVRLVLVQCLTQAAANNQINGTEVFGTTANGTAWNNAQTAVSASLLPGAFGKYRILKDKMIICQAVLYAGGAGYQAEDQWFKFSYKFPQDGCVLDYVSTAANTPNNYGFNLLALADTADYTPSVQGNLRFYYTDA